MAGPLMRASRASWPFVALSYAKIGYAGPRVANARSIHIEVVRKADHQVGFAVIAAATWTRLIICRTFTCVMNRNHTSLAARLWCTTAASMRLAHPLRNLSFISNQPCRCDQGCGWLAAFSPLRPIRWVGKPGPLRGSTLELK